MAEDNISKKIIRFEITEELAGQRLDKALAHDPNIGSRSQASQLIVNNKVEMLAGKKPSRPLKPSHSTRFGEIYEIEFNNENEEHLLPLEIALDIQYEDDHILVVNKQAGLVVHPAAGHAQDTLVNALLFHAKNLSKGSAPMRPGIVHRIDKDTSGLLVIAKNDAAHRSLGEQFRQKKVHRIYWAVTYGPFKKKSGSIESFIARDPHHRKKFCSQAQGRWAKTHYHVVRSHSSGLHLVHLQLETGRTHQIRVHLSELGCPIVSDSIYTPSRRVQKIKSLKDREAVYANPRLCLHAAELGFVHPFTKKEMLWRARWPSDIQPLISYLEFDDDASHSRTKK